jgi:hypothetical protein
MNASGAYIVIRLFFIVILIVLIFFLIILILEITLFHVIIHLLELKSLTSKPIDSTGDQLLLNVLPQLVVELQAFLDVSGSIIIILICWRLRRGEEVEEGLGWNGLLDNSGLLGVCEILSIDHPGY